MKKRTSAVLAVFAVAVAAFLAFSASALAAPHFQGTPVSSVASDGALVVSFDETGLGNGNIDYTLTGNSTAVFGCFNKGGNHPQAANKETINSPVVATGSFESKNGRVRGTITTEPPSAGSFSCPGGQRLELVSVSYTNLRLTDTTNGVSTGVPNASS